MGKIEFARRGNKRIGKVEFTGEIGGDMECFLWRGVSEEEKKNIIGEQNFATDKRLEEEIQRDTCQDRGVEFDPKLVQAYLEQLYPNDVMCALGIKGSKKYKFTITAEEEVGNQLFD